MRKLLAFKTIAVDTLDFRAGQVLRAGESFSLYGNYDDSSDDDVTEEGEDEILRWLLSSSARRLILSELGAGAHPFVARSVRRPVIENSQTKPGDLDLLICEDGRADLAIAIQCKRVKVRALNQKDDDVNKLPDLSKGVKQANFQRNNLGFHRNYLLIVMEAYGRKRTASNTLFRGANQETLKAVYEFPMRESLHEDVGVIFIEISQPTGKSFGKMAVVGVCIDKEAARLDQPAGLTNRIRELINQKGLPTE